MLARISLRDFSIGVLTGIGFTKYWLIADGLLTRTALPYQKPPIAIWVISLIPLLTIFWSLDSIASFLWFWRVHVIYGSYVKVQDRKSLALGIGIVFIVQFLMAIFEDTLRPYGLADNPQRYGMASWALIGTNPFLSIFGGANIGISGARLALIAIIGIAIWTRQKIIFLSAVTAIVFVVFFTPYNRFTSDAISNATNTRIELFTGQTIEAIILDRPDLIDTAKRGQDGTYIRPWRWYGYGYGSYNDYTGLVKPHNTYLLIWYDLGIFSIIFVLAVFWFGLTTTGKPFWLLFATAGYMFFVDDFFGLPIGLYVIAFQFYMVSGIQNKKHPMRIDLSEKFDGYYVPEAKDEPCLDRFR